MNRKGMRIPRRFWLEIVLALLSTVLFVMTAFWPDWIELLFNIDPDQGSGTLEWAITLGSLAVAVIAGALAAYDWRRLTAS